MRLASLYSSARQAPEDTKRVSDAALERLHPSPSTPLPDVSRDPSELPAIPIRRICRSLVGLGQQTLPFRVTGGEVPSWARRLDLASAGADRTCQAVGEYAVQPYGGRRRAIS